MGREQLVRETGAKGLVMSWPHCSINPQQVLLFESFLTGSTSISSPQEPAIVDRPADLYQRKTPWYDLLHLESKSARAMQAIAL
ncbi:MAG: hypothetical protein K0S58_761 [Nitrospira sp.]|jgi:hypothetical protein|nr:hypothetical protein [Nitrospira sp.]